ncbi:rhodanese-like domain-containing protein [Methylolobus aquaticus]|nr:rhodanese-like domain-containing protein [Methylolobus aquaticus]
MTTIRSLNPGNAWRQIQAEAGSLLIDVRDPVEFAFVGHPVGAINVPWKMAPDWRPNPQFIERVRQLGGPETPLFLLCRSGQRSLDAAKALAESGYRNLTNIEEGFEGPLDANGHRGTLGGWRCAGLPWEQS